MGYAIKDWRTLQVYFSITDAKHIKTSAVIRDLVLAQTKMLSDVIVGYCWQGNVDPSARM